MESSWDCSLYIVPTNPMIPALMMISVNSVGSHDSDNKSMKLTLINCSVVEAEGGGTLAKGMKRKLRRKQFTTENKTPLSSNFTKP